MKTQHWKVPVVTIPYATLIDPEADISNELYKGYGPDGLGIITISGVPAFPALRQQLLPLAHQFAGLPEHVKQAYEHAASSYCVGWSHGKEALRSGKMDTYKGSFYANPLQDTFDVEQDTADKYRSYYSPNVWPEQHLPQLQSAFKQLGALIIDVGMKVAEHCSTYVQRQLASATGEPLLQDQPQLLDFAGQLRSSTCHKARLLHYFPLDKDGQQSAAGGEEEWCGWHLDHGALTGLCSAMYIKDGKEVPNPDASSGLYICDRSGEVVQVSIPADHIAYQMGQVMAIQSGGLLRATPHCVRAASKGEPGISRNTFAVFMQPETSMKLEAPKAEALGAQLCLDSGHWQPGMTFGEFAAATLRGYYSTPTDVAGAGYGSNRNAVSASAASPAKEVAPAAVLAAAAASRRQPRLLVSHE